MYCERWKIKARPTILIFFFLVWKWWECSLVTPYCFRYSNDGGCHLFSCAKSIFMKYFFFWKWNSSQIGMLWLLLNRFFFYRMCWRTYLGGGNIDEKNFNNFFSFSFHSHKSHIKSVLYECQISDYLSNCIFFSLAIFEMDAYRIEKMKREKTSFFSKTV